MVDRDVGKRVAPEFAEEAHQRRRLRQLVPAHHDDQRDIQLLRIPLQPTKTNGLAVAGSIMIDKITTAHRSKSGERIGKVSTTEMLQPERRLLVYLGMTG